MFVIKLAIRRLFSAWRFIWSFIRSICCCLRRRNSNNSLLPFVVDHDSRADNSAVFTGDLSEQWNSWSNKPFSSVAEKIEEYRKKKTDVSIVTEVQPDFFNDMEPQVKQPRKAFIDQGNSGNAKQKFFSFNELDVPTQMPLGELGEIDDMDNEEMDLWDTSIDIENVDSVLREQMKEERREKNRTRRLEHVKKFQDKKKTSANI